MQLIYLNVIKIIVSINITSTRNKAENKRVLRFVSRLNDLSTICCIAAIVFEALLHDVQDTRHVTDSQDNSFIPYCMFFLFSLLCELKGSTKLNDQLGSNLHKDVFLATLYCVYKVCFGIRVF